MTVSPRPPAEAPENVNDRLEAPVRGALAERSRNALRAAHLALEVQKVKGDTPIDLG
ncbi:hypothetical protein GCM10027451_27760 [Geodermatophilus aquaeductus]